MAEEIKEESKGLKAKTLSLISKILGIGIIIGGHVLKWLGKLPDATSNEIVVCGFAVMGICGTIDINILVDKFIRKGE